MRILIAEDEQITRRKLQRQLEKMGHEVVAAADGKEAWEQFQTDPHPVVICDWEMPEMNGVELVRKIRAADTPGYVYIIMLTGKSDTQDVVTGMEAGADDFISKPFDRKELRVRLRAGERILELEQSLEASNGRLKHELAVARELSNVEHRKHEESLLGDSIAVRALRDGIELHALKDRLLLLTGRPGVGQEAVARAIHRSSARCDRPFIYVACAHVQAADESIFGFRVGELPEGSLGKASLADGGTLYLGGAETLSKGAQEELVNFLSDAAAKRANSAKPVPDVRVIASTLADLDEEVKQERVSDELARILGEHTLVVPSLAERSGDILVIAQSILDRRARSAGKSLEGLTPESEQMLLQYSWPGNVRELTSVVERAVLLATGTRVEIPAELLREGRRVGGYTLERQLGAGAMGEVWLGRHALLARPSAVKVIREEALRGEASAREKLEERFQREAQATAQLRSPHTVELYDFGVTEEGGFYYVMEYLSGVDFDWLVKKFGPVEPARAAHLLGQACMSLGEAHAAGLVHRDVKPANLFACQLGPHYDFVKLLDFGIVRVADDLEKSATVSGGIKGTPVSLSPEVVQGKQATFASDIYGLGCVAYWLLAGQHVFKAPGVMALLIKHVRQPPTPLSEHRLDLPSELVELVMRCLEKNPADRPGSAFELGESLASIRFDEGWDQHRAKAWWSKNLISLGGEVSIDSLDETMALTMGDTE
jgi:DNA-binding NtrC family response regulator